MKMIRYKYCNRSNTGTEEYPVWHETLVGMAIPYSEENMEIAKRNAYNSEYPIEDDGQPEPITPIDKNITWDAMAEAIREGVNEI